MKLMKVQGKGRLAVEPDIVTMSFDVETKSHDYAETLRKLNTRTEDLRTSMKTAGIDRTELKTTNFNVSIDTQYKGGEHIFAGYSASHCLQIELPVDKELMNRILRHIAKGHSGAKIKISFSVKDKETLRKRVLAEAVRVAKTNASALAEAAGVTLGKIHQIDYGWAEIHIYDREASMVCQPALESPDYDADIEPEDVVSEDNVTLVYEIQE